jgi:CheY-like chemotaxis protein
VEEEVQPQLGGAITATGRILVVEDEDAVRRLAIRALSEQGYSVLGARDGAEALSLLEVNGGVDLVLTDVVMPRMGGRELAERLSASAYGAKVLVMSGYAASELLDGGAFPSGVEMIDKPFSPAQLVSKVATMLAGS